MFHVKCRWITPFSRALVEEVLDSHLLPRATSRAGQGEGTAFQEGIPRAEILVHLFHHLDRIQKEVFKKICNQKAL